MKSDLRAVYDGLYIRIDTKQQALAAARANRKYARTLAPLPALNGEYRSVVRPYWKPYRVAVPGKYSFRLFARAEKGEGGHIDPRYIPDDLWYDRILPHYNDLLFARALQDKCLLNVLFPEFRRPVTVVKCIAGVFYDDGLRLLTREEAIARVPGHGRVIVKLSVGSSQGRGIRFFDSDSLTPAEIDGIFREYGRDFIVQEKLRQHEVMAALNPGSLNTVRILTFLHGDRVHVLNAILRVGGSDSEVDNVSRGGFQCTVLPDGRLAPYAATKRSGAWVPADTCATGVRFADVTVPGFAAARQAVCAAAARMSHFKIIGWDIGIDDDGTPTLIEYNVMPEQNQMTCGPTFGDLTEAVLTEVFGRRA